MLLDNSSSLTISSMTAGPPAAAAARARANAGANCSVVSTRSPLAPKAFAQAAKSGLVRRMAVLRPGYSRS
jgi:hypothetical protein